MGPVVGTKWDPESDLRVAKGLPIVSVYPYYYTYPLFIASRNSEIEMVVTRIFQQILTCFYTVRRLISCLFMWGFSAAFVCLSVSMRGSDKRCLRNIEFIRQYACVGGWIRFDCFEYGSRIHD